MITQIRIVTLESYGIIAFISISGSVDPAKFFKNVWALSSFLSVISFYLAFKDASNLFTNKVLFTFELIEKAL